MKDLPIQSLPLAGAIKGVTECQYTQASRFVGWHNPCAPLIFIASRSDQTAPRSDAIPDALASLHTALPICRLQAAPTAPASGVEVDQSLSGVPCIVLDDAALSMVLDKGYLFNLPLNFELVREYCMERFEYSPLYMACDMVDHAFPFTLVYTPLMMMLLRGAAAPPFPIVSKSQFLFTCYCNTIYTLMASADMLVLEQEIRQNVAALAKAEEHLTRVVALRDQLAENLGQCYAKFKSQHTGPMTPADYHNWAVTVLNLLEICIAAMCQVPSNLISRLLTPRLEVPHSVHKQAATSCDSEAGSMCQMLLRNRSAVKHLPTIRDGLPGQWDQLRMRLFQSNQDELAADFEELSNALRFVSQYGLVQEFVLPGVGDADLEGCTTAHAYNGTVVAALFTLDDLFTRHTERARSFKKTLDEQCRQAAQAQAVAGTGPQADTSGSPSASAVE